MPDWLIAVLGAAAIGAVLVKAFWSAPKPDPHKSEDIGQVPPNIGG